MRKKIGSVGLYARNNFGSVGLYARKIIYVAILGLILIFTLGKLAMAQVWERIVPSGTPPGKRNGHVLVVPNGDKFVFGGFDQDNDLWILRQDGGETWRWEKSTAKGEAPGPRGGHSGIFAREDGLTDDSIIIFGGSESFLGAPIDKVTYRLPDPWNWSSAWEKLPTVGTPPSPRAEHTAVYAECNDEMIVFGGYTAGVVASSETYTLDLAMTPPLWMLFTIGEIPARYGHSAVWGQMLGVGQVIVFGGKDNSGELLDDCWRLQWTDWYEIDVTGDKPPARWQHIAVWIQGDPMTMEPGGMIIFGGEDEDETPLDDVWILWEPVPGGPPDWRWEKIYTIGDLPPARASHAAGLGWGWKGEEEMYVFGGSDGDNDLNDLYTFRRAEDVEQTLEKEGPFNAPNPFNPDTEDTKICYYLEQDDDVKIRLFTLTGELVYSWENISGREGLNQWPWNGRNEKGKIVENGGYICLIEAGGEKQKCKIAVLR